VLFVAGMLVAACGSGESTSPSRTLVANPSPNTGISTPAPFPLTLQRSDGKQVTLEQAPARMISLSPGATEIIYALGAESALVAVDKNANYPAAADTFPTKVDAYEPNVEAIAGLSPDLVIVASDSGGLVAKLDELKIPVLYYDLDSDVTTVEHVLGQIRILGQVTDTDEQAQALIAGLKERVDVVARTVDDVQGPDEPVVYHELDSTYYSAAEGTFVGDLYRILHAKNIAGSGGGVTYPQLTQETIIASNPTAIVLADEAFGVSIESVKARPGWSAIPAVRNNAVFAINPDIISRPGPRIVDALEQLAHDLYPQRFP
jgi:iron complex transport system substrate-binding protein